MLLTAQRRGELVGARWADIDLETGIWCIPAENSKNGHAHRVPLSGDAVALFRQLRAAMSDTCPYVLGHRHGGRWKPYNPTSLSNVPKHYDLFGCAPWTIHDLRRTASTRMREAGTPPYMVERVLNHLPPLLVRTYDRADYREPMREALEVWATHAREVLLRCMRRDGHYEAPWGTSLFRLHLRRKTQANLVGQWILNNINLSGTIEPPIGVGRISLRLNFEDGQPARWITTDLEPGGVFHASFDATGINATQVLATAHYRGTDVYGGCVSPTITITPLLPEG